MTFSFLLLGEVGKGFADLMLVMQYYSSIPLFQNDLKGVSPFLMSSYEYELYVEAKDC